MITQRLNPWLHRSEAGSGRRPWRGVKVTLQGVQSDANKAISAVEAAIGAGVDGIAIVVPDQQIGLAVMKMAADAKIPMVVIDDSIKDESGKPAPFVGFSAVEIGKQVGNRLVDYHHELGWGEKFAADAKILSVEVQSLSVCMDRTDNANKVLMEKLGATADDIIHVPYDPGTLDKALQ